MSVLIETTIGDIVVDLFIKERPNACRNFLKLCKIKYYNLNQVFTVEVIVFISFYTFLFNLLAELYLSNW